MTRESLKRLQIPGITEFWLRPPEPATGKRALVYKPAILIECSVNFRSLRAGLNHSEERTYTAWLPESELAIDWDSSAADIEDHTQLLIQPRSDIPYHTGNYVATKAHFDQYEAQLIDEMTRLERLCVLFNPVFGLFSAPGDALEDFLGRVAEAALRRVEPELRRLRARFELQLEQIREAQMAKGANAEDLDLDRFISHKSHLFESENRIAGMFSTLAGAVFGSAEPRPRAATYQWEETELREDLDRVEQEASDALRALYEEYLSLANEYDTFEIGLQPENIQVMRRTLLWIPQPATDDK